MTIFHLNRDSNPNTSATLADLFIYIACLLLTSGAKYDNIIIIKNPCNLQGSIAHTVLNGVTERFGKIFI